MAGGTHHSDELFRIARTGDAKAFWKKVVRRLSLPPALSPFEPAVRGLLRAVGALEQPAQRARLLTTLARVVAPWLEDEDWPQRWTRAISPSDEDEFRDNVRRLAQAGRDLWVKLFKRQRGSALFQIGAWLEGHPLSRDGIIQISLHQDAADFVFPWTLVYDGKIPRNKNEFPDLEGFWGVRYCIEQQLPNLVYGTDEAVHLDTALQFGFMLWEYFRNAKEQKQLGLAYTLFGRATVAYESPSLPVP